MASEDTVQKIGELLVPNNAVLPLKRATTLKGATRNSRILAGIGMVLSNFMTSQRGKPDGRFAKCPFHQPSTLDVIYSWDWRTLVFS
ncbi:hypothetical protein VTO42DRAFT_7443 [Malbranchea cinnamomea]